MVACSLSSASLGGHIGRSQQEKNESGRPCAYLLPRFSFETRLLADSLRGAWCTKLNSAPSVAFISSCDTGRLLTDDVCVLVSMRSCKAFSQE